MSVAVCVVLEALENTTRVPLLIRRVPGVKAKFFTVTVREALAWAGPGAAAGAPWMATSPAASAMQAAILFIATVYEAALAEVQSPREKSTAETAVARLRLETPSRIGIDKRASARSSSSSLRP